MPAESTPQVPDPTGLIFKPESYVERLDLSRVFRESQPLEVDLGAGDGGFLLQWAGLHPEHNFLGVERLLGRLRKLERKGRRAGLVNLRLIRLEASYVLEWLLPPGCVQALHVYFPDPWPKRRHWPRRLVNARFTTAAAQALAPGGRVYLRTDHAPYFEQMTSVFSQHPAFRAAETPPDLSAVVTDFERDFHVQGLPTLRAAYERNCGGGHTLEDKAP